MQDLKNEVEGLLKSYIEESRSEEEPASLIDFARYLIEAAPKDDRPFSLEEFDSSDWASSPSTDEAGNLMEFVSFQEAVGMATFMVEDPSSFPLVGICESEIQEGEHCSWSAGWVQREDDGSVTVHEGDYESAPLWAKLGEDRREIDRKDAALGRLIIERGRQIAERQAADDHQRVLDGEISEQRDLAEERAQSAHVAEENAAELEAERIEEAFQPPAVRYQMDEEGLPMDPPAGVGTRVELLHDVERYPHFIAPKGATGTVVYRDDSTTNVKMDEPISGAEEWDNEVIWTDAEDISQDARIIGDGPDA